MTYYHKVTKQPIEILYYAGPPSFFGLMGNRFCLIETDILNTLPPGPTTLDPTQYLRRLEDPEFLSYRTISTYFKHPSHRVFFIKHIDRYFCKTETHKRMVKYYLSKEQ